MFIVDVSALRCARSSFATFLVKSRHDMVFFIVFNVGNALVNYACDYVLSLLNLIKCNNF